MRASIAALLIAGCASKSPAPAPAPFSFGANDECAPVEMAAGWHASRAELDQAMREVAADATAVCSELRDDGATTAFADATAVFAAAVPACGAQVAGDRRLALCRSELGCCRMRATSREVAGRRWITVRFPDIATRPAEAAARAKVSRPHRQASPRSSGVRATPERRAGDHPRQPRNGRAGTVEPSTATPERSSRVIQRAPWVRFVLPPRSGSW